MGASERVSVDLVSTRAGYFSALCHLSAVLSLSRDSVENHEAVKTQDERVLAKAVGSSSKPFGLKVVPDPASPMGGVERLTPFEFRSDVSNCFSLHQPWSQFQGNQITSVYIFKRQCH